jgi:MFS family permease
VTNLGAASDAPRRLAWRLPRDLSFWVLGTILGLLLFAASAPSPLYAVYQARWRFSTITLTSVFAVYALALLVALILAGSLSDHVGRRPVLLVGLALEVAGMALFGLAQGVAWLFGARVLQGIATGLASGTISAALIDLQPSGRPARGALLGSVAPTVGLAVGALGSGLLVQYGPSPTHLVYWLLVTAFTLGFLVVLAMPEPVARDAGWWRSLRPHVEVPPQVRAAFVALTPCFIAMWALSGLYLSLGPSLASSLLHTRGRVTGALVIVGLTGAAAVASVVGRGWRSDRAMIGGSIVLIAGVGVTLVALQTESIALFLGGTVLAGLGFGPAFSGGFRSLTARAPASQRAGLIAAIYVVSYLAFSLPAIVAGVAVTHVGLRTTAVVYAVAVVVLAAVAVVTYALEVGRTTRGAAAVREADVPPCPCPGTVAIHHKVQADRPQ